VVVLHAAGLFTLANSETDAGIRETFAAAPERVTLYPESLLLPQDEATLDRAAAGFLNRYRDLKIDVLMCDTLYVHDFLERHPELWPGVPRVYFNVDTSVTRQPGFGPNATGAAIRLEVASTIDFALRLQPDARQVVLVGGHAEEDLYWFRVATKHLRENHPGRRVRSLDTLPFQEQLAELRKLTRNDVAIFLTIFRDAAGESFQPFQVLRDIAQASNAPAYHFHKHAIREGFVGGVTVEWELLGRQASELALRVLRREPADSIPDQPPLPGVPLANWRQLERWGIPQDRLPEGTETLFRPPSLWRDYRGYVIVGTAVVVLQALLLVGLLRQYLRRVRIEAELRESESRFRTMADHAPVMVWMSDTDRRVEWINKTWLDFTGRTQAEARGDGWTRAIHPDDLPRLQDFSERGGPIEYRLRRHDGRYRWVLSNTTWRGPAGGPLRGYVGSCVDITDRKEAEESAQKNQAEMARLSRLALMGELTASLSHELNQPLAAIRANAEAAQFLLERTPPGLDTVRDCLADIVRDDYRASEIINGLRGFAKRQPTAVAPLDVRTLVGEVVVLAHSDALHHRVKVSSSHESDLPSIQGDRISLQQVLLNLLMNAIAATGNSPADRREVLLSTAASEGAVRVTVRDWGHGIAPDAMDQLFQPFFTTKAEGLGMGLPICKNIIEQHRGRIWAENHPEGGAAFSFTLPIAG